MDKQVAQGAIDGHGVSKDNGVGAWPEHGDIGDEGTEGTVGLRGTFFGEEQVKWYLAVHEGDPDPCVIRSFGVDGDLSEGGGVEVDGGLALVGVSDFDFHGVSLVQLVSGFTVYHRVPSIGAPGDTRWEHGVIWNRVPGNGAGVVPRWAGGDRGYKETPGDMGHRGSDGDNRVYWLDLEFWDSGDGLVGVEHELVACRVPQGDIPVVGDIGDGEFVQVRGYLFSVDALGEQGATWFQGVPVQFENEVVLGVLGGALVSWE